MEWHSIYGTKGEGCLNTAILRGIEVLRFVGESDEPVTIAEISKFLDIPKTSVFNIVNTLLSENFLVINNQD